MCFSLLESITNVKQEKGPCFSSCPLLDFFFVSFFAFSVIWRRSAQHGSVRGFRFVGTKGRELVSAETNIWHQNRIEIIAASGGGALRS